MLSTSATMLTGFRCLQKNFHAVLGVRNGASNKEIKSAYHKLAMKWHPDKHPNDKLATAKFQEIAEAYEEVRFGALIVTDLNAQCFQTVFL